ncbi:MAG: Unknown protein [uncultured Thiotrichaceae bacterium]|uniref:Uncharacterized protein n=1 Tax=uncultured Thiotrichaceae bacterium TaxID=298394 RepID=A0A6S6TBQ3_9GAMM|nr:MAG: Unknown protein [uncultured Thiotrichaceae bacterium]
MKVLHFLSVGMFLAALNTPVFAEKEAEVSQEEVVSSVEVEDSKNADVVDETTEAKIEEQSDSIVDEVTHFNAGLANLVDDIMTDEQFAHEEAEEEAAEENDAESDEKIVAKNGEEKKSSK